MSVGTRTTTGRPARRAHDAERVKSGAAQRAYARRKQRGAATTAPKGTELAGRGPFVAVILAMFGCGLALTLVLTTRATEDSYQLSDTRIANRVLSDERAALQREVAAADSAPELATRARELGMIPADDPARLVIAPDGTVTVIGEAVAAQGPPAPPLNLPPETPGSGADPGERIVPVPSPPRADTAGPGVGSVLAAPGADPAQPGQAAPQSEEPVPGQQPPAGAGLGPQAGTVPEGTAPPEAAAGPSAADGQPAPAGQPAAVDTSAPGVGQVGALPVPAPQVGGPVVGDEGSVGPDESVPAGGDPVEVPSNPVAPVRPQGPGADTGEGMQ